MKREDVSKIFEGATEEQINALLNINSADIGNAKKKLEAERDNYKSQLETAKASLKEFEGVNVDELNAKITTLTADLEKKETEYQNKISDMEFNSVLDSAISKSGARNSKAVKALLDLDALKASKNQAEDITKALENIKSENDYMFGSDEPFKNPVKDTGHGGGVGSNALETMRAAMGLPTENK
jgi:hypothetical protein